MYIQLTTAIDNECSTKLESYEERGLCFFPGVYISWAILEITQREGKKIIKKKP